MITCSCGKTIEKVPAWMSSVNVEFVCNNCPNRQTKNIAFVTLEPDVPATAKLDLDEDMLEEGDGEGDEPIAEVEP